jgi:hypothetical protein
VYCAEQITWYLSSLHTAVVGTVRSGHCSVQVGTARQRFTCSKNITLLGVGVQCLSHCSYETVFLKRRENIWSCVHCSYPLTSVPLHVIWRKQWLWRCFTNTILGRIYSVSWPIIFVRNYSLAVTSCPLFVHLKFLLSVSNCRPGKL